MLVDGETGSSSEPVRRFGHGEASDGRLEGMLRVSTRGIKRHGGASRPDPRRVIDRRRLVGGSLPGVHTSWDRARDGDGEAGHTGIPAGARKRNLKGPTRDSKGMFLRPPRVSPLSNRPPAWRGPLSIPRRVDMSMVRGNRIIPSARPVAGLFRRRDLPHRPDSRAANAPAKDVSMARLRARGTGTEGTVRNSSARGGPAEGSRAQRGDTWRNRVTGIRTNGFIRAGPRHQGNGCSRGEPEEV